ncbi:uncharacterized protein MONBRDRAFT_37099 [Monosiga brevicollis MX1]|uniref:60S acidic ribosomal protein P2 n=1 Tax=Monosiga brevicollis TaxID=81824 RepID=A9UZK8_MONBE|nr:uncharacterized protein MONBRDRAFT_37099 [Monosiga brevicollis MX1]EDQ89386.1 predicted protein [Monosiga brevicollis MX1]|eukprot:XP_001745962.1 hypothetical protein [Monosiga brevicollis MX1]
MRYVAAYLLAALGGNAKPSAADLKKIFESVGVSVDDEQLNTVISQLADKELEELIAEGQEKLASVPSGGAAAPAAAAAGGAGEAKAEEKAPEPEESEDEDMDGFSLFD